MSTPSAIIAVLLVAIALYWLGVLIDTMVARRRENHHD
jgi:hypothetical protein